MEEKMLYKVSGAPFVRAKTDTQRIMLDVLIALLPAFCVAAWQFGAAAIVRVIVSVVSCVFFEFAYRKLMKKSSTIHDLSACVTGVLLVFCMPAGVPIWMIVIASFLSIVLVKQLYGGIGKNFLNPALAGRAFMLAGYALFMTTWPVPSALKTAVDGTTMATPLGALYGGTAAEMPAYFNLVDMFIGKIPGCIGEISTAALLIGFAYLLIRKVIGWQIPVTFVGTVAVLTLIFGREGYGNVEWMLFNLCSGGLMLGAIFMATDYCTSPVTPKGQLIYGVGCGALTVLIRYFGGYPEGVSYAILIMNLLVWAIDKATPQRQFGVSAEELKAAKQAAKAEKKAAKEAQA
ncbi:MAG: RnfABCDGE type electron transport complex subunit D [Oscillospiraceae bacterium]|jgi:electron transport complex protein RnfD|nr:RnfABCDGE type electron transport complex subunit D [Oscillospiraceae bacterium]